MDMALFRWFCSTHPAAVVSFQLATIARQWRIAYYTLVDFLRMRHAWAAALEPDSPSLRLTGSGAARETAAAAPADVNRESVAASSTGGASYMATSSSSAISSSFSISSADSASERGALVGGTTALPPRIPVSITAIENAASHVMMRQPGEAVYSAGDDAGACYVILWGSATASARCPIATAVGGTSLGSRRRAGDIGCKDKRVLVPGCIAGGPCCFADVPHLDSLTALTPLRVAVFTRQQFSGLRGPQDDISGGEAADQLPPPTPVRPRSASNAGSSNASREVVLQAIAMAIGRSQAPLLHLFSSHGLQRLWLKAGEVLFRAGELQDGLYIVISGRIRTFNAAGPHTAALTAQARACGMALHSASTGTGNGDDHTSGGAVRLHDTSRPVSGFTIGSGDSSELAALATHFTTTTTASHPGGRSESPALRGLARIGTSDLLPGLRDSASTSGAGTPAGLLNASPGPGPGVAGSSAAEGSAVGCYGPSSINTTCTTAISDLHELVQRQGLRLDIGKGESCGEIAVLTSEDVRLSSAVCIRDVELVKISNAAFRFITEHHPAVMAQLARVLALRYRHLTERLAGLKPGSQLTSAVGQTTSGGSGSSVEGVLRRAILRSVASSTGIGSNSDLAATAAAATAAAATAAGPLPLPPSMPAALSSSSNNNLHGSSSSSYCASVNSPYVTISIVPAGAQPPAIHAFTQKLVATLTQASGCSVLHLDSTKIDKLLGSGTSASLDEAYVRAKVGSWLSSQEERYRFVVFEADEDPARTHSLHGPTAAPSSSAASSLAGLNPLGTIGRTYFGAAAAREPRLGPLAGNLASRARTIGRGLNRLIESSTGITPGPLLKRVLARVMVELKGGPAAVTEEALLTALQQASTGSAHGSAGGAPSAVRASAWSKLCVQQADLCLLVGQAHTPAALSVTERQCVYRVINAAGSSGSHVSSGSSEVVADDSNGSADSGDSLVSSSSSAAAVSSQVIPRTFCQKELVLLHDDASRPPRDTRSWLRSRRVSSHHHVRTAIEDDTARIARFICGTANGLVLGGGGSRGLAHLGVFKVRLGHKSGV